ncbi:MAG TPA: caspase family protein, partial [Panacibacter sp.]|nr:caspase family protein [Panacibacter sp.]
EDGNTSDYYPTKVAYTVGDDDMEAEFSENSFLEQKDLTEKLVGQFFRTDEDFYRNNTEEAITRNPKSLTPDEKKAKMYLVIVANTLDADIGASCIKDKDRTLKTFTDLAQFMKIQFEPRVIFDNDFDKAHVDGAIQAIQPNPNDIVIFYYSGHGFTRNDKYTYPYMALTSKSFDGIDNSNSLNIQEVYNQLNAKGARLTLVLSDCCNSDPNATNAEFGDVAATRTSGLKWNLDNCKALFLTQKRTSILMTAASRGELSAGTGNLGGIFTYNFRTSMVNYFVGGTKDDITWDNLLKDAQAQTIKKAENTKCKEENGSTRQCVQHPVYQLP